MLFDSLPETPAGARRRPGQPRPRKVATESWALEASINVVLFAGLGGACEGLEDAGFPVHLAINHDAVAVAVHKHRNPHTRHLQTDVFEVDPREATGGRPVNILWASPDCRHHSRAKGGKPVSNRVRSLPWVVCRWAGQARPARIFCENVRELRSWCPLIAKRDPATGLVLKLDGTVAAKGERVPVQDQQLVPDPKRKGKTFRRWQRHQRGLGYIIEDRDRVCADFGIATTRNRFWEVAVRADVADTPIVWRAPTHAPRDKAPALGLKAWTPAASIIDWSIPMRSIFGRAKSLAEATLRRIARGVMKFVINAAEPFIIPVTHTRNGGHGRSTAQPVSTLTTAKGGELAVVAPVFSAAGGRAAQSPDRDPLDPLNTSTTKEDRILVAPVMVPRYGERDGQDPRCQDAQDPLATQVNTGNGASLVGAFLQAYYGEGGHRQPRVDDPCAPIEPLTTSNRHAVTAAWMVQHNTGEVGHDMAHPVSTMVQKMCTQALAAAHLVKLRGTCRDGQPITVPLPALGAGGNHEALIAPFLQKYYSTGGQDQAADGPLDALTTKARFGLVTVTIGGQPYVITDILMRMLEPEEGAAAHGFKPPYFPETIEIFEKGKLVRRPLTKAEKMALVGNSVPPFMARILVEDNCPRSLSVGAVESAVA